MAIGDTEQQNAVNFANQLAIFAANLQNLRGLVSSLQQVNASVNYNTIFLQLATFAWNADGSAGAADSSPIATHPISAGGINRSENQLLGMTYMLTDFQTFLSGGALSATGSRSATIDQMVG